MNNSLLNTDENEQLLLHIKQLFIHSGLSVPSDDTIQKIIDIGIAGMFASGRGSALFDLVNGLIRINR